MEELNVKVGAKLRELREKNRFSLRELEYVCGVSNKSLWAYETGKSAVSIETLTKILKIYGMTVGQFLTEIGL